MSEVMSREVAEQELQRIIDFWEVDPEGENWQTSKKRLLFAIQKGRIMLDEEKGVVRLQLLKPIESEKSSNGSIEELEFKEPNGEDLKVMDKYKESETMARTLHLASKLCNQPLGIINRMASRDVSTMGALAALFF